MSEYTACGVPDAGKRLRLHEGFLRPYPLPPPGADMKKLFLLLASHTVAVLVGFAAGIYVLPILIAPPAPAARDLDSATRGAQYKAEFRRDLKDSDALHWGEGTVFVGREAISLRGKVAPGPDYKLYLSPEFVETEADFMRLRPRMTRIGDVKTFDNFIVPVPAAVDPDAFNTVIVWCETFSQFITAARYR